MALQKSPRGLLHQTFANCASRIARTIKSSSRWSADPMYSMKRRDDASQRSAPRLHHDAHDVSISDADATCGATAARCHLRLARTRLFPLHCHCPLPAMPDSTTEYKTYRGCCHCKAVVFRASFPTRPAEPSSGSSTGPASANPPALAHPEQCDCSFCTRHGVLWAWVPPGANLMFERGREGLSEYSFGQGRYKHLVGLGWEGGAGRGELTADRDSSVESAGRTSVSTQRRTWTGGAGQST